jgi:beta-xylosidase
MRGGAVLTAVAVLATTAACTSSDGPPQPPPSPPPVTEEVATYTNPVHAADTPDPQAIRVGDTWHLFHTNAGGRNVPMLTSPDLVTWTPVDGDALPRLGAWATPGKTWAPEVIALAPDRYVLYYTAASTATGRQCIGAAVAQAPGGPYVDGSDRPLVCQADDGGSIDASPFRDTDGALYLLWKNDGNAIGADTWLWSQRLSPDGLALTGKPARLLKQTAPWEGSLIEGPFMWRHDGRLYLFYAANDYGSPSYAEGYAVCATPSGPCSKGPRNPILRSQGTASGPGHASIVEKDGRTWLLYHAWPAGQEGSVDPGRQLWLDELLWANGDPVVRGPTDAPQPLP